MMPWWWRLGAGLGGLGALAIAPYLAGACIFLALGFSFADLRYGHAYAYWQVLGLPAYKAQASRIAWAGGLGLLLAPGAWASGLAWWWWRGRDRRVGVPRQRQRFDPPMALRRDRTWRQPGSPLLSRDGWRRIVVPRGESVLLAATTYPATYSTLQRAVCDIDGPLLVLDVTGALYAATAGRRARKGRVLRLSPFGGGMPWNPLAAAWSPRGLVPHELGALARCWYPEHAAADRAVASHLRDLFVSLVFVVDLTLRDAGEPVPPSPGDLWRLVHTLGEGDSTRHRLRALAVLPGLPQVARDVFTECAAMDDHALRRLMERLREGLCAFATPETDAGTRGAHLSLADATGTVYVDLPYARRHDTVPIVEALVAQWQLATQHRARTVVIHAADLLPALPFLACADVDLRCMISVRSVADLFEAHDVNAAALARRFGVLALHAPGERVRAEREGAALARYAAAQTGNGANRDPAPADDLLALRPHEQIVLSRSLRKPVRCPVIRYPRRRIDPPIANEGHVMPFPKPLAALLASLVAGCSAPVPSSVASSERTGGAATSPITDSPLTAAWLGSHRFRLPRDIFRGLHQPSSDGSDVSFVLHWPSLEPLPEDVYMYRDQDTFLSSLRISVAHLVNLNDEAYRVRLRRDIEPLFPEKPIEREDPSSNLHLRIKGEPVHGLTPYYTDFDKLKRYYVALYGPDTTAADPSDFFNDDWYLDMGPEGIPRTVLKCSPAVIPDGVSLVDGELRRDKAVFLRATCDHSFLIPEYRAYVSLTYQRIIMSDWRRIEERIRGLLRDGEIKS